MKKRTAFIFILFAGFVISIVSITVYKKNPCLFYETKKKIELSLEDIVNLDIFNIKNPQRKTYNRVLGFNSKSKTYKRPIKYYIHNKNGSHKFKILSLPENYTYEISSDAIRFIVDTFERIDSYLDVDFERVTKSQRANIEIYKAKPPEDFGGLAQDMFWERPSKYKTEIIWSEPDQNYKGIKLKNYPNLTYFSAATIVHEIGHALGLSHADPSGKYQHDGIDPYKSDIDYRDTIMSYNFPNCVPTDEDVFFSDNDLNALRTIWGLEKGN